MSGIAPLRLGLLLPTRGILLDHVGVPNTKLVLDMAREAESAGFDSVWVGDSLTAKPRLEPLATLAAVASVTRRVRLGTAVLLAPLRQPVLLAQTAATVDLLSGGRLTLGLGVGGAFNDDQKQEWQAAGIDPSTRGRRMTEMLQAIRHLWTGEPVPFQGEHVTLRGVRLEPRPHQHPGVPMLAACHYRTGSEAQVRRAALHADGIIAITDSPAEFAETLERVHSSARQAGRDPTSLHSVFYMTVNINPDPEAAFAEADDFIRRYYGVNFWGDSWGPFGPAEAVAERMLAYAKAGAREIIVRFASKEPRRQMETFLGEVLPLARSLHPA